MTDFGDARWHEVDDLFARGLDLPREKRAAWLREVCADDEALRSEVEDLLREADTPGFPETAGGGRVGRTLVSALGEPPDPRIGQLVGVFRLVRCIGRGGMADVYLGERDSPFEQRVAVKIQRRGVDVESMLARFQVERQILSRLEHPNIARLIDGGATTDGFPYLVMEYIEGQKVTTYCEEQRLSLIGRLRLFVQVAEAVQAAHAHLVVHRDIKPSNVLVTADGRPKLLDFGIAKLLDPTVLPGETPRTRTGLRPLTPEYASPEQVRGGPVTTATDVYQLGLLLYEMLTGGRPFQDRGRSGRKLEEAITDTRPRRPSDFVEAHRETVPAGLEVRRLARRLRGELDTILLTALAKEPGRRYPSAVAFGDDVRRHLQGHPIHARRDSTVYRTRKFFERNVWAAPTLLATVVVAGLYVATLIRHGRQMETERNAARIEAARARASQDFVLRLFESTDPVGANPDARHDMLVSEAMEQGIERARTTLGRQPELQTMILGTIGGVFFGLGDVERAEALRWEAYRLALDSFGENSPEAAMAHRALVEPTLQRLLRKGYGQGDSAMFLALDALSHVRRVFGHDHVEAARAEIDLVRTLSGGRVRATVREPIVRHALSLLEAHDETTLDRARALDILTGILLAAPERRDELAELTRRALVVHEAAYGEDHPRTAQMRIQSASLASDPAEADRLLEGIARRFEARLGPFHDATIAAYRERVRTLGRLGEYALAAEMSQLVLDRRLGRGDDPSLPWYAAALAWIGEDLHSAGRYAEAEAALREAVASAVAGNHPPPAVGYYRRKLAWAILELGRPEEAVREALLARDEAESQGPQCVLARALRAVGRDAEADSARDRSAAWHTEAGLAVDERSPCRGLF